MNMGRKTPNDRGKLHPGETTTAYIRSEVLRVIPRRAVTIHSANPERKHYLGRHVGTSLLPDEQPYRELCQ